MVLIRRHINKLTLLFYAIFLEIYFTITYLEFTLPSSILTMFCKKLRPAHLLWRYKVLTVIGSLNE